MKCRVRFSAYASITTGLLSVLLIAFAVHGYKHGMDSMIAIETVASLLILVGCALFCMPLAVSADSSAVKLHRALNSKRIPMTEITSVEVRPASNAKLRLWGSRGFFGYWGRFTDERAGHYTAFYGKESDCFLLTLKSGQKYMLGCENHRAMTEYISKQIK
jgi:hypothetical protein